MRKPKRKAFLDLGCGPSQLEKMIQSLRFSVIAGLAGLLVSQCAQAGVFNIPHFVDPGSFALGLEPEVILTSGAGVGLNGRYTYGLNDLLNASVVAGSGGGPRRFRVGADMIFDFFPDFPGQPGVGVALQGLYVRVPPPGQPSSSSDSIGQGEWTAIPYIHKAVPMKSSAGNEIEPYLAVPFGLSCNSEHCNALVTVSVGTLIRHTEHI